ncbi:zinc ABC transporter permease [candidate division KSB3 bacterium]|uniref:Zinc ABC transporter permease n=1 Tax=candidate division KSB3 bacterium TaxID=2044937 RepID=A0A2G6KI52_9BACT|nr:MAG: zinc ABC transporter permease [candidate division KSB3 bacterium]
MNLEELQIILIASLTAVACALPGVFLVLRRMALMSDAMSHSILLGIVIGFFLVEDLASPLLILGAGLSGLVMAMLVEALSKTRMVKEDAAIGLVFPALFSTGVIMINLYAGNVHLDIDAVLLGELVFAPFNTLIVAGVDIGPKALYVMLSLLLLNLLFIALFYKELKLSTFDAGLAASFGFLPGLMHYAFMGLVSMTAVGAFDTVGSILVIALMIAPPATAYLLTDDLVTMLGYSAGIGIFSAVSGFFIANSLDSSIAGCMATMTGICFLVAFWCAPKRGMFVMIRRRRSQKLEFARGVLAVHLSHHAGSEEEHEECCEATLTDHIRWEPGFAEQVVASALQVGLLVRENGILKLTPDGLQLVDTIMEQ